MLFNTFLIATILILYALLHINNKNSNRADKLFLIIVFVIFTLLVGFRDYNIGNDTPMYLNLFNRCSSLKWNAVTFGGYFEPGYLTLNVLISYISSSSRFFLFIMSVLFNIIIYLFIRKYSKNYLLSVLMYICFLTFYTSMTMLRQFCAILIVIYSFNFAKNKNIFKFLLCIAFATLFHSTAWVGLLIYPMVNIKISFKSAFIMLAISIIICIFIGPLSNFFMTIIGRKNYYASRVGSESISNIIFSVIYLLMFIYSYIIIKRNGNNYDKYNFYVMSILFTLCVNIVAINMNILSRVADYFQVFTFISFPNLIFECIKSKKNQMIISIVFILFLFAYSSTIITFRPEWNSSYRYRTSIFTDINYFENYY